ncbi:MAG: squalene synthase HpnC [Chloroflexi bacterium]|nr:squalene synthase HpnC [Chloroflexota bacterium]
MKQHLAELDETGPHGPAPRKVVTVAEANAYCAALARRHYENFTVGSALLPRPLRKHFFAVYSFCRWADDLGDELGDRQRSLEMLAWWRRELDACYADEPIHPVFVALHETIRQFAIPRKPFDDLIDAFVQDQSVCRYETFEQLVDYCTRSANPVGRLVLYLCGYSDERRQQLSDFTCTALQLANFWQDVERDLALDRVYLPREDMERFGYSYEDLQERKMTLAFRDLMQFEVQRTREWFERGAPLVDLLLGSIRLDIQLFTRGGTAILVKIAAQDYDVLTKRPALSRREKIALTAGWFLRRTLRLS